MNISGGCEYYEMAALTLFKAGLLHGLRHSRMLVIFSRPFQLLNLNHPETQPLTFAANPKPSTFTAKPQPSVLLANRNCLTSCVAEARPSTSCVEPQPSTSNTGPSNTDGITKFCHFAIEMLMIHQHHLGRSFFVICRKLSLVLHSYL